MMMKTVTYKDAWGKNVYITYYESPNIDGEAHWHAEVSQEVMERLLERAGVYRAE